MTSPELSLLAKQLLLCKQGSQALTGDPPSLEELVSLLDNQLPFDRKREIFAYLNANPALMDQWVAIVEARHDLQHTGVTPKNNTGLLDRLLDILFGRGVLALSSAATVVLVLVTVITVNDEHNIPGNMTSIKPAPYADGSQQALNQILQDTLDSHQQNCQQVLSSQSARATLQQQLFEVKALYTRHGQQPPPPLLAMKEIQFQNSKQACLLTRQLTQALNE